MEDDLLIGRACLGEEVVGVGGVEVAPDAGVGRGDVEPLEGAAGDAQVVQLGEDLCSMVDGNFKFYIFFERYCNRRS